MIERLPAQMAPYAAWLRLPKVRALAYGAILATGAAMAFHAEVERHPAHLQGGALAWIGPIANEAGHVTHDLLETIAEKASWSTTPPPAQTVRPVSVAALERHLAAAGFEVDDVRNGDAEVPRLFLASLPADMQGIVDTEQRKRLFISAMLPHILSANERILADRERLLRLAERYDLGLRLKVADEEWLVSLAEAYGLEEPDFAELKRRVDIIPASLAIAQSAAESGWGTSRFAIAGNAVFGQYAGGGQKALIPRERPEGATHAVRSFDALDASVDGYMRNLNTHPAYGDFRRKRERMRIEGQMLDGRTLSAMLTRYSVKGVDYVRAIHSIMRTNQLDQFDRARLGAQVEPVDNPVLALSR
jgi:Bax protein